MQRIVAVLLLMLFAGAVAAKSGWREVKLEKDGRYGVDSFVMKGADLIGYFEEIKETERVTDVVLVSKTPVVAKEENRFAGIAEKAGLKAHIKEGRQLRDAKPYVPPSDGTDPAAETSLSMSPVND